jgi:hypothetical protein
MPATTRRPAVQTDPIRRAIAAAEQLRVASDALERALGEAVAAGLSPGVRVTPPLGAREGWRVEVTGAGW